MFWSCFASFLAGKLIARESRIWNTLRSWGWQYDFWTSSSPIAFHKISRLLNDSESPMVAEMNKNNLSIEFLKKDRFPHHWYIGITAKSHSNSFTLFRYFFLYFSGFMDNDAQNTVSKSWIFRSPQIFFPEQSLKESLFYFKIMFNKKKKKSTYWRASVICESDNHCPSPLNRSRSTNAKCPKFGRRKLTLFTVRVGLNKSLLW